MYPSFSIVRAARLLSFFISVLCFNSGKSAAQTTDFVTVWKTDNTGTSASNQITIPVSGSYINYNVNWGDGNTSTGLIGSATHTYAAAGTYTVRISGSFPGIYFNNGGDRYKLLAVTQWGSAIQWETFLRAFYGCSNMDVSATDTPRLAGVTNIAYMFASCSSLVGNASFANWHTDKIYDMDYTFQYATQFNQNISGWNNTAGQLYRQTFFHATAFNQNLGKWNISKTANGYLGNMLSYSGLSVANYDSTLIGWQAQTHQPVVGLGAIGLKYCASATQRAALIAEGWTINDAGQLSTPIPNISLTCGTGGGIDGNTNYGHFYESNGRSWLWSSTTGGRFYTGTALSVNTDSSTSHLQAPYIKDVGTYSVIVGDANGCTASGTYTVTSTTCNPVILAQNITGFTVYGQNGAVYTTWYASGGNDYFLVQRSSNGVNWQNIGRVQQAGYTGSVNQYRFADTAPLPGTSYYRTAMGNSQSLVFTNVKQVNLPTQVTATIYPNPASNMLLLKLYSNTAGIAQINITSTLGVRVITVQQPLAKGANHLCLPQIQPLPQGLYCINITWANNHYNAKFVKTN